MADNHLPPIYVQLPTLAPTTRPLLERVMEGLLALPCDGTIQLGDHARVEPESSLPLPRRAEFHNLWLDALSLNNS